MLAQSPSAIQDSVTGSPGSITSGEAPKDQINTSTVGVDVDVGVGGIGVGGRDVAVAVGADVGVVVGLGVRAAVGGAGVEVAVGVGVGVAGTGVAVGGRRVAVAVGGAAVDAGVGWQAASGDARAISTTSRGKPLLGPMFTSGSCAPVSTQCAEELWALAGPAGDWQTDHQRPRLIL